MTKSKSKKKVIKKHKWITYDDGSGDIDLFAGGEVSVGFHNGPKCARCGFQFCVHCDPQGYKTRCPQTTLLPDDAKLSAGIIALDRSFKRKLRRPKSLLK